MKKNRLTALFFLLALLLTACGKNTTVDLGYPQQTLTEPDAIQVITGASTVVYEKGSEEYRKIFDTFRGNWWLTAKDTPDAAPDSALTKATSPDSLKTTSNRTYAVESDTFICFLYEENSIQWLQTNGKPITIQMIAFVMPEKLETDENVRGFFTISQTDAIGYNEGLFTYYYPAEVAGGFWDFLVH